MKLNNYLGKEIEIIIDRPLGSKHPKHNFTYELNYGFVPNTKAPDGEEIDAYLVGTDKPIDKVKGQCIALIHRKNDDDDKLVIALPTTNGFTKTEIAKLVNFQEKWFDSEVIM